MRNPINRLQGKNKRPRNYIDSQDDDRCERLVAEQQLFRPLHHCQGGHEGRLTPSQVELFFFRLFKELILPTCAADPKMAIFCFCSACAELSIGLLHHL